METICYYLRNLEKEKTAVINISKFPSGGDRWLIRSSFSPSFNHNIIQFAKCLHTCFLIFICFCSSQHPCEIGRASIILPLPSYRLKKQNTENLWWLVQSEICLFLSNLTYKHVSYHFKELTSTMLKMFLFFLLNLLTLCLSLPMSANTVFLIKLESGITSSPVISCTVPGTMATGLWGKELSFSHALKTWKSNLEKSSRIYRP